MSNIIYKVRIALLYIYNDTASKQDHKVTVILPQDTGLDALKQAKEEVE